MVTYAHVEHGLSLRRACQAFSLSRSVYGYQPKESDDELVIDALVRLAEKHPRFGFGKLFPLLRREQPMWNHKRVLRVAMAFSSQISRVGRGQTGVCAQCHGVQSSQLHRQALPKMPLLFSRYAIK
ncbi:MAG: hypothetical protein ACP59X_15005 [Solidesulfovibrio sp. DCME]|uniref:hypothetical protein n=1 Tax=Solidesulfovibrio sp. DCME TaxID=3447380 RepID=UPI003D11BC46